MTKNEYFKFHQECCEKMTEITRSKNADYTGAGDDPFANFTRVESLGICSTEQGFLTRMTDKLSRLSSFVQQGTLQVKDESAKDTLLDLANYCILMAGYLEQKHHPRFPPAPEAQMEFSFNDPWSPRAGRIDYYPGGIPGVHWDEPAYPLAQSQVTPSELSTRAANVRAR